MQLIIKGIFSIEWNENPPYPHKFSSCVKLCYIVYVLHLWCYGFKDEFANTPFLFTFMKSASKKCHTTNFHKFSANSYCIIYHSVRDLCNGKLHIFFILFLIIRVFFFIIIFTFDYYVLKKTFSRSLFRKGYFNLFVNIGNTFYLLMEGLNNG